MDTLKVDQMDFTKVFGRCAAEKRIESFSEIFEDRSSEGHAAMVYSPKTSDISEGKMKLVELYLSNGLNSNHPSFEVENIVELENNLKSDGIGIPPPDSLRNNNILLWHGTNMKGAKGIIEKGFRIPNSQSRRSKFGNGLYFADRVGKCLSYCGEQVGYLLLCGVKMQNMFIIRNGHLDGSKNLPTGFDSIKAEGKNIPDPAEVEVFNDAVVPLGPTIPNKEHPKSFLAYSEYVVYDPSRVDVKFLLKIRFTEEPL